MSTEKIIPAKAAARGGVSDRLGVFTVSVIVSLTLRPKRSFKVTSSGRSQLLNCLAASAWRSSGAFPRGTSPPLPTAGQLVGLEPAKELDQFRYNTRPRRRVTCPQVAVLVDL